MGNLLQIQEERGMSMTKEWPKELPPFEQMKEIFFKGAWDPDGDVYHDSKSGKRFWVNIMAGTAEEVKDA